MTNHLDTAPHSLLLAASRAASSGAARRRRRRRGGLVAAGLRGFLSLATQSAREILGSFAGGMGGASA